MKTSKLVNKERKQLFSHLPYSNCNIVIAHSQFNNSDNSLLPTRKKLEKLTSLYDLDLFDLNSTLLGDTNIDPDQNRGNISHSIIIIIIWEHNN